MKGLIFAALATTASAGFAAFCGVPAKYQQLNGGTTTTTACNGAATGYRVFGHCVSAFLPLAGAAAAPTQTAELTTANRLIFTVDPATASATTFGTLGCLIPSNLQLWNVAGAAVESTVQPLAAAPNCGASQSTQSTSMTIAYPTTATDPTTQHALTIVCDTANDYFPVAGREGSLYCNPGLPATITGANGPGANTANLNAFQNAKTTGGYFALAYGVALNANYPSWYNSSLTCGRGCVLPAGICNTGNVLSGNLIGFGPNFLTGTTTNCLVRPGSSFTIACRAGNGNLAFQGTCTGDSTSGGAGTLVFTQNGVVSTTPTCGPATGALTGLYSGNSDLAGQTQNAGDIIGFPLVTSSVSVLTTVQGTATAGAQVRAVNFVTGTSFAVTVVGCGAVANSAECVQQALNYWRCRGLMYDSGTVCLLNSVTVIACPTPALGFTCPNNNNDDSKKGLLGLLGLLGIIPLALCLLLSSLLLCCFCRKTKKEGDVHFATFDPHAAPIAGSIAPGLAPTGFAPSAYAPSIGGPALY